MLNMLETFPVSTLGFHSADELHLLVEVMRRAFADRAALFGDTDFVKGVPVAGLVSPKYAAARAATIDMAHATPSETVKAGPAEQYDKPESTETTHFVVVDADGNVVTNTYTLNGGFGAGVVATGTGVLLNNEMDDFAAAPGQPNLFGLVQSEKNAIAPRKRPLSSMTPTILLKDGHLWIALGSPGGPTIVNTVLQLIVDVVDFGMNVRRAMDASRLHHQWLPDRIVWEPFSIPREVRAALEAKGHKFADQPVYIGDAQVIAIDEKTGVRLGACDPRNGGVPVGY
jgi:gamma-glutamyltranspeptidase/glutathione hydrolase